MNRKYIVKVNYYSKTRGNSYSYWTLSGSTIDVDKAYVFTDATVPDLFKGSLEQSYVEKIYL